MNPTQEIIKRLFLSIAISVAALIAGTSSAAAAVTTCDGILSGTHDTVLVPKGRSCEVNEGFVTVEGNVILQEGASLLLFKGNEPPSSLTIIGNLLGDGVSEVHFEENTAIHGNVSITGATSQVTLQRVTIGGNLNISDSSIT